MAVGASFGIFDTEYMTNETARQTKWGGNGEHREVIQIAAAVVKPGWDAWAVRKFEMLVKPVFNPLNDYTTQLTGITPERMAKEGLSLEDALYEFSRFVDDRPFLSNGMDINVLAESAGLQRLKMPLRPLQFGSFHTPLYAALGRYVKKKFDWHDYPSGRVHELVGIPLAEGMGQVHDALRDVWSLAVTIDHLEQHGHSFVPGVVNELVEQAARLGHVSQYNWG